MKKIIYLILLLTCHQLWGREAPWVKIYEGPNPDNTVNNYFYLEIDDTDNYLPDTALGGATERSVVVTIRFEYTFVRDGGARRTVSEDWSRNSVFKVGKVKRSKCLWRLPNRETIRHLNSQGFYLTANTPTVVIRLLPSLRDSYQILPDSQLIVDGVQPISTAPIVPIVPDLNFFDDDDSHFRSWLREFFSFFDGGFKYDGFKDGLRHLKEHKYTTYSISEGTGNDNWQKTRIRFNTGAFKAGVEMEHIFRLVYEYNYVHPTTKVTKQIVMTKMVTALIPTDMIVEGTVYAPFPPIEFSQWLANNGYLASVIKVTLESPHMLPQSTSSESYVDGTSTKFTDANPFDNHFPGHYFDRVCTAIGTHDHVPYVEKNGLILEPRSALMRSQTVFKN